MDKDVKIGLGLFFLFLLPYSIGIAYPIYAHLAMLLITICGAVSFIYLCSREVHK